MQGVKLIDLSEIRTMTFYDGNVRQWRKKYKVSKTTRKYSWNDVMGVINKIQAPYYKKV